MKTNEIKTATFGAALSELKKAVDTRKVNLKERHIVFVPDHSTLRVEQLLFAEKGAFDVEVLTFNRFFLKVFKKPPQAFLSREGGIMLIKKIVDESVDELQCFFRSADKIGFSEKLYETLNQLLSSDVEAISLANKNKKLSDISLILQRYKTETENVFLDSSGKMRLMIGSDSVREYLKNAHLYFANFDSMTPLNQKAVHYFCSCALSSKIFSITAPMSFPTITAYEAESSVAELKAVCKRIRDFCFNGGRYGDIGVVASNACFSEVKRVFSEYEIPFYLDNARLLSEHPFVLFLSSVFKAGQRLKRNSMIALSRNTFLGCDFSDVCEFENYVNTFCIDYLGFLSPFNKRKNNGGTQAEILREDSAERVRAKVADVYEKFAKPLTNAKSAESFCERVSELIDTYYSETDEDDIEIIFNSFGAGASNSQAAIFKLKENLELLKKIMPSAYSSTELYEVLMAGLNSVTLSPLPLKTETVIIGEPSAFRGARIKKLFVIGASEGKLPRTGSESGLISDREILKLREQQVQIDPTVGEVNERALNEFLSLVADSEEVFISYNSAEGRITSAAMLIAQNALKWNESSSLIESQSLALETDNNRIARHCASKASALELLICSSMLGSSLPFAGEILTALNISDVKNFARKTNKKSIENNSVFFKNSSSTISRLQEFYECPYRHFLTYGLKLKEKKDGSLSPVDVGSVLHKIIELFVREKDKYESSESRVKLIDKVLDSDEKCRLEANKAISLRVKKEALTVCEIVARQMARGEMKNLGVEMKFGKDKNCEFPALKLGREDAEIILRGTIDRVDTFNGIATVIDYKTGRDKFNFKHVYFGKKLQLPLYLKVLKGANYLPGGMFYFPFRTAWDDDERSHRLSGIFLKEKSFYCAMDSALLECGASSSVLSAVTNKKPNKSGEAVLSGTVYNAVTDKEIDYVLDYAVEMGESAIKSMQEGIIERLVLTDGVDDCGFCPYKEVCGDDGIVYRSASAYGAREVRNFLLRKEEETDYGD